MLILIHIILLFVLHRICGFNHPTLNTDDVTFVLSNVMVTRGRHIFLKVFY